MGKLLCSISSTRRCNWVASNQAENITGNSGNVSIGFTADNFEEAGSLLKQLSIVATNRKEEGGEFLHFTDPDGTALYFIKPKW